jgi:hypothetical protein
MKAPIILLGVPTIVAAAVLLTQARAQETIGEQIGAGIDRGLSELREEWREVRKSVEGMGVQGRVYSRLRWDKAIETGAIDIEVRATDVVVLQGTVPTAAVRQKAVQLARDTVGVASVVDQLTIAEAP